MNTRDDLINKYMSTRSDLADASHAAAVAQNELLAADTALQEAQAAHDEAQQELLAEVSGV